jgi:hypothetical protein
LYDLASLQKLLNITLLHDYGYKEYLKSLYPEDQSCDGKSVSSKSAKKSCYHRFQNGYDEF